MVAIRMHGSLVPKSLPLELFVTYSTETQGEPGTKSHMIMT